MFKVCLRFLFVAMLIIITTAGCVSSSAVTTTKHQQPHSVPQAIVTIPHDEDIFSPFILTVQPQTTVIWRNDDTRAHAFATTADRSNFLNPQPFSLVAAGRQSVSLTFTHPGLYHYDETMLDSWSKALLRVEAGKNLLHYPIAMEGIIWVQGAITELPTAVTNQIPHLHDDFATEFLAIKAPGMVTWHNFDTDVHFVGLVPNWSAPINPVEIGLHRLAGQDEVAGGQSLTIPFSIPGLYYYYCRNHDLIDTTTNRVQAIEQASEYPVPMEGFVLVVG